MYLIDKLFNLICYGNLSLALVVHILTRQFNKGALYIYFPTNFLKENRKNITISNTGQRL